MEWWELLLIALVYFRMGAMYATDREEYATKLYEEWSKTHTKIMDKGGNAKKVKIIRYGYVHDNR